MHFVMHAFNNHVKVLHIVTPFVLLQQTAVLSDEMVFAYPLSLHQPTALRHQIMVTVNEMNEWIVCADAKR